MSNRLLGWMLVLLFLTGVLCSRFRVEYQQPRICAVKGSNVTILCSFHNPDNQEITVSWGRVKSSQPRFIPVSRPRKVLRESESIGNKRHQCSLRITQVEHHHAGKYVVCYNKTCRAPGGIGPTLTVVDLTISMTESTANEMIKEGDSVRLTCVNACDDRNNSSAFSWFKNGEYIYEGRSIYLGNITSTDSGNYTCSLKTSKRTASRAVHINVEYGPKNTSVSVRPPAAADVGIDLTLVCSSHANPPVENYTWFKSGSNGSLSVGRQPEFVPADAGHFFCSGTNKHGSQNSSVFPVNKKEVKDYQTTISKEVFIVASVAAFLIVTVIVAVTRLCQRRRLAETNTEGDEDEQNPDYVNWLTSEAIQPHDTHPCEQVTDEVNYTAVYFHKNRERNMEEHQSFQHEDVIYSTVCSDLDINPTYM